MSKSIRLTSHPAAGGRQVSPIRWGERDPAVRGAVVGTTGNKERNVVGTHSGSYGIYRALAVALPR